MARLPRSGAAGLLEALAARQIDEAYPTEALEPLLRRGLFIDVLHVASVALSRCSVEVQGEEAVRACGRRVQQMAARPPLREPSLVDVDRIALVVALDLRQALQVETMVRMVAHRQALALPSFARQQVCALLVVDL